MRKNKRGRAGFSGGARRGEEWRGAGGSPWRGSVAVALRKVESGARAARPQHRGSERSVTVQRVSVLPPRPARRAATALASCLSSRHCSLCELRTFPLTQYEMEIYTYM